MNDLTKLNDRAIGEPELLTKREYIAALAMQALITAGGGTSSYFGVYCDKVAQAATAYADALLKELEKETQP